MHELPKPIGSRMIHCGHHMLDSKMPAEKGPSVRDKLSDVTVAMPRKSTVAGTVQIVTLGWDVSPGWRGTRASCKELAPAAEAK